MPKIGPSCAVASPEAMAPSQVENAHERDVDRKQNGGAPTHPRSRRGRAAISTPNPLHKSSCTRWAAAHNSANSFSKRTGSIDGSETDRVFQDRSRTQ